MKQFEYITATNITKMYKSDPEYIAAAKRGDSYIEEHFPMQKFLNKLGQEGWDISVDPSATYGHFFAKREIPQERTRSYTPSSSISR